MFRVLAKMEVVPGKSEVFRENILKLAPQTKAYPGCLSYEVLQSTENENIFWMCETWEDEKCFQEHFSADFTKEFEASLEGVAAKDVEPYICKVIY